MKILIIGDEHAGIGNGNPRMLKQQEDFYNNLVIPTLQVEKIDMIVSLGDNFDKRSTIDINVLNEVKRFAYDKLKDYPLYIIVGNHNLYYRNTDKLNNIIVLNEYDNIHIVDKPITVNNVDLIPWVSEENKADVRDFIFTSNSKYCFGHFEFNGFPFDKTRIAEVEEKITQSSFKKYVKVFSGHYHTHSEKNNIIYTGAPYQLTWIDYDDEKFIYILDTETDVIAIRKNNDILFNKYNYDEALKLNRDQVEGKIIKVIYDSKITKDEVNSLANKLNELKPENLLMISNNIDNIKDVNLKDSLDEGVSVWDNIDKYTKTAYIDENEYKSLISILETSYKQSISEEE